MGLSPVMSVAKDFSGIRSRRDFVTDRYFHVTLQRGQTAGERPELGLVGVSPCCRSAKRRLAMQRAPPQPIFLPSPVTRGGARRPSWLSPEPCWQTLGGGGRGAGRSRSALSASCFWDCHPSNGSSPWQLQLVPWFPVSSAFDKLRTRCHGALSELLSHCALRSGSPTPLASGVQ